MLIVTKCTMVANYIVTNYTIVCVAANYIVSNRHVFVAMGRVRCKLKQTLML